MKLKRYYYPEQLTTNTSVIIDGEEFHHMVNVMRSSAKENIVVFNGDGNDYFCKIQSINKKFADIFVEKCSKNPNTPTIKVTLYQAVCKGEKLSLITQKITELGATAMTVFYSKFTDIKDKTSKLDKLDRVSISACKQCGRSDILRLNGVISFDEMVKHLSTHEKVFVAYENADGKTLYDAMQENSNYKNIAIMVGAEGGFSENEIQLLQKCSNVEIVSLGNRILRTETAAIAGTAQLIFACEK
ncbi:MAG: 16S rRNA (uracil(1498)-N(3))-methyltransferase [Clostridia bacterium]|nr:16S rRNA (uracil(1498)-N(3))-methyltransferase [Clostridia bacterium]